MDKIEFNTGRQYAPEGQIIEATVVERTTCPILQCEELVVEFDDKTRHIRGRITCWAFTQEAIMACYDRGYYTAC